MRFKGKAIVFGNHLNTDEIIPARCLYTSNPAELASHLMEDIRPGFGRRTDLKGSIIVAGENAGCGSSREHAPLAIRAAGISCVVAKSFARIFLRNSINIGLPIVEIEEVSEIEESDQLEIDFHEGKLINHTRKKTFSFPVYPRFLNEVFLAGGWLEYVKKQKSSVLSDYLKDIAQFPYRTESIRF